MFENTVLSVATQAGLEGAYFAYGTLWVPSTESNNRNFEKFFAEFKDTVLVTVGQDELAVDFIA